MEVDADPASVHFKWEGRPLRMRFPAPDDYMATVIRRTAGFYEIDMLRDIRARLFFGKCAVDVGAHVGNHTLFFSFGLGMRTIAFEPNPSSFELLEANVRGNRVQDKCQLHRLAVAARPGRARLLPEWQEGNSGTVACELDDKGDVEVVTLDDMLKNEPKVDLIKIDAEGLEIPILEGAKEVVAKHRPLIYAELNERQIGQFTAILNRARYVRWMRFNYTPMILFMPAERFAPISPASRSLLGRVGAWLARAR